MIRAVTGRAARQAGLCRRTFATQSEQSTGWKAYDWVAANRGKTLLGFVGLVCAPRILAIPGNTYNKLKKKKQERAAAEKLNAKSSNLPWKSAQDGDKTYYYHVDTRETQWDKPEGWTD
mmetsp:Transcript_2237/g.2618  ORF Transcript_2237/g.2618 Transcript_2237/m.2618 type:complete len:119 (+) Transcript_2237:21-377(+)|eukprot:CAMPEP_0205828678 /NCGR_PEP_ID=MMETSP0206-20130828/35852_1 /ASSEMBLY_ACC=CAM_ASM_000279 /TAXON_ID=36767 /ORGANISM="Euplotes focardii, Strain TN1" /LENGTH=118 /DNA_ID=CAMNT_0053130731 /DNA_START=21 /DNA_END=377 /DNA_ORIENTATION=-